MVGSSLVAGRSERRVGIYQKADYRAVLQPVRAARRFPQPIDWLSNSGETCRAEERTRAAFARLVAVDWHATVVQRGLGDRHRSHRITMMNVMLHLRVSGAVVAYSDR